MPEEEAGCHHRQRPEERGLLSVKLIIQETKLCPDETGTGLKDGFRCDMLTLDPLSMISKEANPLIRNKTF